VAKKVKTADGKKKAEIGNTEFFAQLAAASRNSRTLLSRQLLSVGLYAGQDSVILALDTEDGQLLSSIAGSLGVRAPTMTKTINRLVSQGFVEKRGSETDGRQSHVYLTSAGRDAVKMVRKAIRKSQKAATEGIGQKDFKTLMKLLKKLEQNIETALQ
jgi:DNA-binding MarR family transcriptional regulator